MVRRITAVVGSYRKGGTIDSIVSEILSAAGEAGAETHKIYLADKRIELLGAKPVATLYVGLAAVDPRQTLPEKALRKARRAGLKLAR
jgi:hypothetical protein